MAIVPDQGDITPPNEPPTGGSRVTPPVVWSMLVVCLLCVVAGVLLALFAPRLWRKPAAPSIAAAPISTSDTSVMPATSHPDGPLPTPIETSSNSGDIDGRLQAVEGVQGHLIDAAAEALAVSTLAEAAQTSAPFAEELASLERILPSSRDLYDLRSLAELGAPSRAALAADFDAAAAKAIVAARAPEKGDGLAAKALYALSAVVVVRRVDSTAAIGPDAALAKAGRLAAEGDLEGALTATQKLSPKAQTALGAWRTRAERRVEIDHHISALRQAALADLAQAQGSAPGSGR